ncbi:MAG: cell division protein ZapA [Deltaproteobacteria bacterium]|nr:cell division protein ZapA [Deltaproteobacteria bacterium]
MATKKSVSVRILDQTFHMTTDASPERVDKIAEFLSKNLQQAIMKSKSGSPYQAAILAALNITEKYFDAIEKQGELKSRVTEKSKKILGLLESAGSPAKHP